MKVLAKYIAEKTQPSSFNEMLDKIIKTAGEEGDKQQVIVAPTDDGKDVIYIFVGIGDKFLRDYVQAHLRFEDKLLFKAEPKDPIFKSDDYKEWIVEMLRKKSCIKKLKSFISDVKNNTTKVCKLMTYKDFSKKYN